MNLKIFVLLLFLLVPIPVYAQSGTICDPNTYYIDYESGNDNNNGTCTTSSWKHAPGDTQAAEKPASVTVTVGTKIIFKGGVTYEGTIQIDSARYQNGSSMNRIILRSGDRNTPAWGAGRAVIDGKNTRGKGFYIIGGLSFITIDGFEIMNMANQADSAGIFVEWGSSSDFHILNNLIHHIYGARGSSGYGIETSGLNHDFIIEFNEVYFVEEKAIELYATTNSTVRYNYLHQTNDHNMVISGANNSIYGNLLTQAGYDWDGGGAFIPAYSFKVDSGSTPGYDYADYNNIYNNIIWDTTTGLGILNGKYNNFYNNVVYYVGFDDLKDTSGGYEGFTLRDDGTSTNSVTGNKITNNIFYYVNLWSTGSALYSVGFSFRNQSNLVNNEVRNNIFYYNSSHMDFVRFSDSGTGYPYSYHNLSWFEGPSGFAKVGTGNIASGNIVADPNFLGGSEASILPSVPTWFDSQGHPNSTGFMLTAPSPARDIGLVLDPPFNVDIDGVPRPQGSAWDIGAYEYVSPSPSSYHYVRAGATGANDGSDWTNAWASLPATLQRGHTYYIADGSYGPYVFNTPESGDNIITIKKATVSDHGTSVGWSNDYGNGQAVFDSACIDNWYGCNSLRFSTGYWILDGATGSWDDITGYGFVTRTHGGYPQHYVSIDAFSTYVTLYNITIRHIVVVCSGASDNFGQVGLYAGSNTASINTIIQSSYFDNCSVSLTTRGSNWLIEKNYFNTSWSSSENHGIQVNAFNTTSTTFRYNILKTCLVTGCLESNGVGNVAGIDGWTIYGNLFLNNTGGNGIVTSASQTIVTNTHVYGNTVIDSLSPILWQQHTGVEPDHGAGNVVKNNLLFNSDCDMPSNGGGPIDHDYNAYFDCTSPPVSEPNIQTGSGSPFVSSVAGDYHLTAATNAGVSLLEPYNLDPDGKIRGADGTWDRGAYEFVSGQYHRSDTNTNGCVELSEMISFMDRWKISSSDVAMPELMESIGLWKAGTGC
jgi:hypothetical protein